MNQFSIVVNRYFSHQKVPYLNSNIFKNNCFNLIQRSYLQPSISHASILQHVKELKHLQQVHAYIVTSGLAQNIFLSNRLTNSYASCGLMNDAEQIFHRIPCKNVVSWTILISGYAKNYLFVEAIGVFSEMVASGLLPNDITISSIVPAFGKLGLTQIGKSIHSFWIRRGYGSNVIVETAIVGMYSRFGHVGVARKVFDNMPERNDVSWNAIIECYSDHGFGEEGFRLFNLVRREGFTVDCFTIMSLISAASSIDGSRVGEGIHSFATRTGFQNDQLVRTALMNMYVNRNCTDDAYFIFNEMKVKDVVAWTLMLTAFSSGKYWAKAIEHFNEMMRVEDLELDSVALTGILKSCSSLGALHQGRGVHALVVKIGFTHDMFVGSAMIDMYANCANLEDARIFFEGMEEKDVACWNAMIAGNGMNGYGNDAVDLFLQMKGSDISPDESTLVCVLCACSHAGMVDKGLDIFSHMVKTWNIVPSSRHYACVVDLLSRAGRLRDAYSLVNSMPFDPDFEVYCALLSACKVHGKIELGIEISNKLFQLEPNDAGYYVLLSNMYALSGNWESVKMTRVSLRAKGLKKDPGFSSIEINGELYTFMAGQKDHPQYSEVEGLVKFMIERIKEAGYVPDTKSVLQELSDDVKFDILYHHSEKLAIAFGLGRTKRGTIIRITKNLRTCNDCHYASKFISKVFERVLVVKDANRFHVFEGGVCSCKDFW
ncbi:pentatricopeptide repeat-containing protein At3g12770-like [Actinidia eriantha]|uniref:pentatricopeptide repeat-containing protein At3g12770-like n=1 Tax=Actinidia eriantha TaxID=165200 RepID=UPI00258886A2|nr:pentatricopeptide repeat-containing protein At3g12770-like [Actinidia eriantha]XP_057494666.1 pentatricopeptide repeat-containing protein At3g12770-like [Actinidia eriantha]XP_057494667.1 pentatricopeptide repeat-containing protein At3g12770-like [Actinidia eriantha]XP_057494668.1 pentatricopeptide repeat-containing protein At3g12770-like [Actinidia eriantha]XP_057494669.1 pentatricopeptide repeat-containing protein At3g12770-like [Actinidia eriantha]XP_057494670.1 pentatricopeptide repeat-